MAAVGSVVSMLAAGNAARRYIAACAALALSSHLLKLGVRLKRGQFVFDQKGVGACTCVHGVDSSCSVLTVCDAPRVVVSCGQWLAAQSSKRSSVR